MSALPFLSDDEIRQLVNPLTQPAAIVRWFRRNGFPDVRVRPNGLPLRPRAQFDTVYGNSANDTVDAKPDENQTPDVSAYLAKFGCGAKPKVVSR